MVQMNPYRPVYTPYDSGTKTTDRTFDIAHKREIELRNYLSIEDVVTSIKKRTPSYSEFISDTEIMKRKVAKTQRKRNGCIVDIVDPVLGPKVA